MTNDPNITDWITAIATVAAAVGTVGAIWFALWQLRRQERTQTKVVARHWSAGNHILSVKVIHAGGPPLRIVAVYASYESGADMAGGELPDSTQLPVLLRHGDTAEAHWLLAIFAEDTEGEWAVVGPYRRIVFEDSLGGQHSAPFPTARERRRGWPLRRDRKVPLRFPLNPLTADHLRANLTSSPTAKADAE